MSRLYTAIVAIGLAVLIGPTASAEWLTFDGLGLMLNEPIPQNYGDNLSGTRNITVHYRTLNPADNQTTFDYLRYHTNTPATSGFAIMADKDNYGEVALIPEAGWKVTIQQFDIGALLFNPTSTQVVRILDQNFATLIDYSPQVISATQHTTFYPNLSHDGPVRIQFSYGTNEYIGIDNIQFSQVAVPEPSTLALCAIGIAGWGLIRSTRRRAKQEA